MLCDAIIDEKTAEEDIECATVELVALRLDGVDAAPIGDAVPSAIEAIVE